jgi:hypothetical protein
VTIESEEYRAIRRVVFHQIPEFVPRKALPNHIYRLPVVTILEDKATLSSREMSKIRIPPRTVPFGVAVKQIFLALALFSCHAVAQSSSLPTLAIGTPPPPTTLADVRLTGTVTWHVGPDNDSGTVTLEATRSGKSRIDFQLSRGTRSEVRVNDAHDPHLFLLNTGTWKESAAHNAWVDANWFFPLFSTAAVGTERGYATTPNGSKGLQAQLNTNGSNRKSSALIQSLSTVTFDLDPETQLPTRMRWFTHPDNNLLVNIRYSVRYSDYRIVNGIQVPFHVQRYFNGLLRDDITITDIVLNPGIPATDFSPTAN